MFMYGGSEQDVEQAQKDNRPWRSENEPVYIFHSNGHYETLIPESWTKRAPVPDPDATDTARDEGAELKKTRTTPLEKAVDRLEESIRGGVGGEDQNTGAPSPVHVAGGYLTPAQMADDAFRKAVEDEIINYDGPGDPIDSIPGRPAEVLTETHAPVKRKRKRAGLSLTNRSTGPSHPNTTRAEADQSMIEFAAMEANHHIPVNYRWTPFDAEIVDVRYIKIPGGLKVQVRFDSMKEFVDWLLVAKSRMLRGMSIKALGVYADQFLPAGKTIGLYTGRILGDHSDKHPERYPLTNLRHAVLTVIGDDDKLLSHRYNDGMGGSRPVPRLVDGGHGAATSGTKDGETYDPRGVGVIFPWTYVHMTNDPRGAIDPDTGRQVLPNATFPRGKPGLRVLNPIYPREEIRWTYDGSKVRKDGTFPSLKNDKGYGKRMSLFQQAAKGLPGAQDRLDIFMTKERGDALLILVEALQQIVASNKRIRTREPCADRSRRACVPPGVLLLDEVDMRNVRAATLVDGFDKGDIKELKDAFDEYKRWREKQAF
eukprot:jgi/Mesvir1/22277/Mv17036-RA.1